MSRQPDDTKIFVTSSNLGLTTFTCTISRKNNSMRQVMPSTSPPHIQLKMMHTATSTSLSVLPTLSLALTSLLSSTPISPSSAKQQLYFPLLSNFKPPGFIFQVLAFNSHGVCPQRCLRLLYGSFCQSPVANIPTAFIATDFLSYATQRLSILVNIGTIEMIKKQNFSPILSPPRPILFFFLVVNLQKKNTNIDNKISVGLAKSLAALASS
jgi:hypothetical protein